MNKNENTNTANTVSVENAKTETLHFESLESFPSIFRDIIEFKYGPDGDEGMSSANLGEELMDIYITANPVDRLNYHQKNIRKAWNHKSLRKEKCGDGYFWT